MSLYEELAFVTLDGHGHSLLMETPSLTQTHSFNAQAAWQRRQALPPFLRQRDEKHRALNRCAEEAEHLNAGVKSELLCPFHCVREVPDVGPSSSTHLLLHTVKYTDCGVRSTVTLPTSVHKHWSQRYPSGCPEEIHTQELDIRVVHKWKSIDLASARGFLNSRFAETDAICEVCPGVIQTGPWLLNTIRSSRTVVFNLFQLGKPF